MFDLVEIGFVLGDFGGGGVLDTQRDGMGGVVGGMVGLGWGFFGFFNVVNQAELGAGHAQINFGQEFAVDECAVKYAATAVDFQSGTQCVK